MQRRDGKPVGHCAVVLVTEGVDMDLAGGDRGEGTDRYRTKPSD